MFDLPWVNRYEQLERIGGIIKDVGKERRVVFIKGGTGVGKSRLTKRVLEESNYPFILKISISKNAVSNNDDSLYLRKIAKGINELSKANSDIVNIEKFNRTAKHIYKDEHVKKQIIDDVGKILIGFKSLNTIREKLLAKGKYSDESIFESNKNDSVNILIDYLQYAFTKHNWILNVENIQNIDSFSLEVLLSIVELTKKSIFIFEFTENQGKYFSDFAELFDGFNAQSIPINPLHAKDLYKIVEDKPRVLTELIEKSYEGWNGNLVPLKDIFYSVRLSSENTSSLSLTNATEIRYNQLSKDQKLLIYILFSHEGEIEYYTLLRVLQDVSQHFKDQNFEYLIESLIRLNFIKMGQYNLKFGHDSIQDVLGNSSDKELYLIISYKIWFEYYSSVYERGESFINNGNILVKLLFYSTVLNISSKPFNLLNKIKNEFKSSINKRKILNHVVRVKERFEQLGNSDRLDEIRFWLAENYQNLSLGYEAYDQILKINKPNKNVIVLRLILMEMTGRQEQAITEIENILADRGILKDEYELCLRIIKFQCKYDLADDKFCSKEFNNLTKISEYKNFFTYGFLLRNAELVLDYKKSLNYYLKSKKHFERFDANIQANFSLITYSIHLGLIGQFEQAEKSLEQAYIAISKEISDLQVYYNNKGVFCMYNNEIESAILFFNKALCYSYLDFDKCAVLSNLLAANNLIKIETSLDYLVNRLIRIIANPRFASKRIIWYSLYNISKYYASIGDHLKHEVYMEKLSQIVEKKSSFYKHWVKDEKLNKSHIDYYRFSLKRPISYLTHWNIEYDSSLMKFQ